MKGFTVKKNQKWSIILGERQIKVCECNFAVFGQWVCQNTFPQSHRGMKTNIIEAKLQPIARL